MEYTSIWCSINKTEYPVIRNIFLYFLGSSLSNIGSVIYSFAIGLYILELTGSALNFALTFVLSIAPRILLLPIAGVVVDKIDRKSIVIVADLISGLMLLALYLYLQSNTFHLPLVYASVFFLTLLNIFFSVAMETSIPNLVDDKRLVKINSFKQIAQSGPSIAGPILGGFFYATLDLNIIILINSISFLISAFFEIFINFNLNHTGNFANKNLSFFDTMKDGFNYLRRNRIFFGIYVYFLSVNFFFLSNAIIFPHVIVNILKMTSLQYGIIQGATPFGLIFMSILWSKLNRQKMILKLGYTNLIIGLILFLIGVPSLDMMLAFDHRIIMLFYILINFSLGLTIVSIRIPLSVFLQKNIENHYRGRVLGLLTSLSRMILPISSIFFGYLIDAVHPFQISLFCSIAVCCIGLIQLRDKNIRDIL